MKKLSPLAPFALLLVAATVGAGCDSKPLGGVDGCSYDGKSYPSGKSFPASDGCNICSCQNGQAVCSLLACVDGSSDAGICFDNAGNQVACPTTDGGATDTHPNDAGVTDGGAKDSGAICFDMNGKAIPCMSDAGAGCTYNGKSYKEGASFPCTDGCNTCTCTSMGIAGTTRACLDGGVDVSPTCFDTSGNIIPCGTDGGGECIYEGKPYPVGASFSTADGCNTCNCAAGGMVACTHKTCVVDAGTDAAPICFDASGKIIPCTPDGGLAGACMPGADQTCNDDVALNTLLGKCRPDATCDCGANPMNPLTGRCVPAGMMTGCSYAGTTYPVGSKFMCSVDAGCNDGICFCATPGTTVPLCGGQSPPVCGFDAVYVYGQTGGRVAYSDQVTLTPPASYVLVRTATSAGALGGSCGPALPACTAGPIDVSDIMRDIADPTVQLLLSLSTMQPTLLGIDQRPVDGTVFSFRKGGTAGFLVGAPCQGATNCTEIPGGVRTLMDDLQKLDALQRQDPSCATFTKTM